VKIGSSVSFQQAFDLPNPATVRPMFIRYVAEHSALLVVHPAHPKILSNDDHLLLYSAMERIAIVLP
jgi:hypothetical protein